MTENATERRAALCMLLIAHTVYNAYSERTVAHEYGIDMNNVLQQPHKQQALRDETAPRKHRNLGESRANDDIIYERLNSLTEHSNRSHSMSRWRTRRGTESNFEVLDYDLNGSKHTSAAYKIVATLDAGPGSIGSDDEMATRWQAAVNEAFLESRAKHFGQKSVPFTGSAFRNITFSGEASSRGSERVLTVQIMGTECSADGCKQAFSVLYNGELVPAEVVTSDLSLLSLSRISAHLMLPVRQISTVMQRTRENESQWWIVAAVVGGGIAIIMCGWLTLFVYYNTCGRPYQAAEDSPHVKKVYLKDELAQTEAEKTASETAEDDRRSSGRNQLVPLEEEVFSDVQPQLPPMTSIKHQETHNIDRPTVSEPTALPQKAKESGSSKSDDLTPEDAILDSAFVEDTQRYPSRRQVDRPMSARPRKPTRAIEGRTINKMEALRAEREWNPYLAGDEVYRICGIGATTSYPRPIPLSTSGVLEVSSLADTLESTPMRYL